MTTPRITGFRYPYPAPPPGTVGPLAILTVEYGPLLISGVRLFCSENGALSLQPPKLRAMHDRIVFRGGPERQAVLDQARQMFAGVIESRSAETPVATAPRQESHDDDPSHHA